MTKGPDGLGMRAFLNSTSNSYFSRHEYITTDYNKNTDLHKVITNLMELFVCSINFIGAFD